MGESSEVSQTNALVDIRPPPKAGLKVDQPSIIAPIEKLKPGTLGNALEDQVKKRKKENNPALPVKEFLQKIKPVDYLFVFGRGPAVIEQVTKEKPDAKAVNPEALSLTRINALAAGEIYLAGLCNKIILTGGHTAGIDNPSEADEMEKNLLTMGIPRDKIIKNEAGNSLENFGRSIKQATEDKASMESEKKTPVNKYQDEISFGLVGSYAHMPRIRNLAYIFGLKSAESYSAEEIFKLIAYLTGDNNLHKLINQRINLDDDLSIPLDSSLTNPRLQSWQDTYGPTSKLTPEEKSKLPTRSLQAKKTTYFENQRGKEAIGIREFITTEQFLDRGLMNEEFEVEINGEKKVVNSRDFYIGYLIFLDDKSFLDGLKRVGYAILSEYGIRPEMSPDEKRNILKPYTIALKDGGKRPSLEMFFSKTDEFSDASRQRLETIAEELNYKKV